MASIQKRDNGKWRARYRDDAGKQHARHFNRKVDAQRWLDEVTAAVVTGQYVDPKAGTIRFRDYAEQWRHAQVHRPSSEAHIEGMLRRHAYPTFGDRQIATILPSEVQAWVRFLGTSDRRVKRKALAPETISVIHSVVSAIMRSAVRDRRIIANPCEGTRLPQKRAQGGHPAHDRAGRPPPRAHASGAACARDVHGRDRDAPGRGVRADR